jgi:peroxiredoxin
MVVAISPMLPKYTKQAASKLKLSFPVLSDPGNMVAKQFGLVFTFPDYLQKIYLEFGLDIPRYNGDNSWELPMPARYVIGQNGTVENVEANPDYTIRPEPEDTLAVVRNLKKAEL